MRAFSHGLLLGIVFGVGIATAVALLRSRASQAWFWSTSWQAGERRADADIAEGRTTFFESDESFEKALLDRPDPPHADAHTAFA